MTNAHLKELSRVDPKLQNFYSNFYTSYRQEPKGQTFSDIAKGFADLPDPRVRVESETKYTIPTRKELGTKYYSRCIDAIFNPEYVEKFTSTQNALNLFLAKKIVGRITREIPDNREGRVESAISSIATDREREQINQLKPTLVQLIDQYNNENIQLSKSKQLLDHSNDELSQAKANLDQLNKLSNPTLSEQERAQIDSTRNSIVRSIDDLSRNIEIYKKTINQQSGGTQFTLDSLFQVTKELENIVNSRGTTKPIRAKSPRSPTPNLPTTTTRSRATRGARYSPGRRQKPITTSIDNVIQDLLDLSDLVTDFNVDQLNLISGGNTEIGQFIRTPPSIRTNPVYVETIISNLSGEKLARKQKLQEKVSTLDRQRLDALCREIFTDVSFDVENYGTDLYQNLDNFTRDLVNLGFISADDASSPEFGALKGQYLFQLENSNLSLIDQLGQSICSKESIRSIEQAGVKEEIPTIPTVGYPKTLGDFIKWDPVVHAAFPIGKSIKWIHPKGSAGPNWEMDRLLSTYHTGFNTNTSIPWNNVYTRSELARLAFFLTGRPDNWSEQEMYRFSMIDLPKIYADKTGFNPRENYTLLIENGFNQVMNSLAGDGIQSKDPVQLLLSGTQFALSQYDIYILVVGKNDPYQQWKTTQGYKNFQQGTKRPVYESCATQYSKEGIPIGFSIDPRQVEQILYESNDPLERVTYLAIDGNSQEVLGFLMTRNYATLLESWKENPQNAPHYSVDVEAGNIYRQGLEDLPPLDKRDNIDGASTSSRSRILQSLEIEFLCSGARGNYSVDYQRIEYGLLLYALIDNVDKKYYGTIVSINRIENILFSQNSEEKRFLLNSTEAAKYHIWFQYERTFLLEDVAPSFGMLYFYFLGNPYLFKGSSKGILYRPYPTLEQLATYVGYLYVAGFQRKI